MTTKPRARKYRIRRSESLVATQPAPELTEETDAAEEPTLRDGQAESASEVDAETDIAAIRREGLTGRQLRMARRVAQKQGLAVTSDFDAVRQLRARGIDPFRRKNVLDLVVPDETAQDSGEAASAPGTKGRAGVPQTTPGGRGRTQLPKAFEPGQNLPATGTARPDPAAQRAQEIAGIRRDIARRRRRNLAMLLTRLAVFVLLPTFIVAWYFTVVATPMYSANTEFTVREAESQGTGGLGGLFAGTGLATQQDATGVQSYLQSRDAMLRLDADHGFKAHFSQEWIDPLQRLAPDATNEDAFSLYQDHVKIGYDPTEGILKLKVIAADPEVSQTFAEALVTYAEERVDEQTRRLREDQMEGARASYEESEERRAEALREWLTIQQELESIDPIGETATRTQQIGALESERQQLQLTLRQRLNVNRPNQAQVDALRSQIADIDTLIDALRQEMTAANDAGTSLATRNTELRLAEENYMFQTALVQQALQQMEAARAEANRQVSYLTLNVRPIAPDEATYPRAFENAVLAFLIFSGIYLMISLTASILREQVTS